MSTARCTRHRPERVTITAPAALAGWGEYERCTVCGRVRPLGRTRGGALYEWQRPAPGVQYQPVQ